MRFFYFQIKSRGLLLLLGFLVTVFASCESNSASNSNMVVVRKADKGLIEIQANREKDSSCCQSNIPDRFAVPSKKMKIESLDPGSGDH